jgi:hypothetical protein
MAGKKIRCSGCGAGVRVPHEDAGAGALSAAAAVPPAVVKFRCPACGQISEAEAELAGTKVNCSGCGATVRVPPGKAAAVAQPSRPALDAGTATEVAPARPRPAQVRVPEVASARAVSGYEVVDASSSLDDLASIDGVDSRRRAGTVLPSRSEMMEQVRQKATEEAVAKEEKARKSKKKKRKGKKKTGYFDPKETLTLVAGVAAVVGVITILAWRLPDLRFPLGGFLCVVGFIVYVLGMVSLRQLVAEEGVFKLLLFRFCPPYQWWYVMTNWADTKDYVAFFGAGLMIMSLGGAVIKTSDVGKQAAAADRALQKAKQGTPAGMPPVSPAAGVDDDE